MGGFVFSSINLNLKQPIKTINLFIDKQMIIVTLGDVMMQRTLMIFFGVYSLLMFFMLPSVQAEEEWGEVFHFQIATPEASREIEVLKDKVIKLLKTDNDDDIANNAESYVKIEDIAALYAVTTPPQDSFERELWFGLSRGYVYYDAAQKAIMAKPTFDKARIDLYVELEGVVNKVSFKHGEPYDPNIGTAEDWGMEFCFHTASLEQAKEIAELKKKATKAIESDQSVIMVSFDLPEANSIEYVAGLYESPNPPTDVEDRNSWSMLSNGNAYYDKDNKAIMVISFSESSQVDLFVEGEDMVYMVSFKDGEVLKPDTSDDKAYGKWFTIQPATPEQVKLMSLLKKRAIKQIEWDYHAINLTENFATAKGVAYIAELYSLSSPPEDEIGEEMWHFLCNGDVYYDKDYNILMVIHDEAKEIICIYLELNGQLYSVMLFKNEYVGPLDN